jgi:hypothetical protein
MQAFTPVWSNSLLHIKRTRDPWYLWKNYGYSLLIYRLSSIVNVTSQILWNVTTKYNYGYWMWLINTCNKVSIFCHFWFFSNMTNLRNQRYIFPSWVHLNPCVPTKNFLYLLCSKSTSLNSWNYLRRGELIFMKSGWFLK